MRDNMDSSAAADGVKGITWEQVAEGAAKGLGFAGNSIASGFFSSAGGFAMGQLLTAVGLQKDPNAAQLAELEQINATLTALHGDMQGIKQTLDSVDGSLKKLVSQSIYNSWQGREVTLSEAFAHIQTDWDNYRSYTTLQDGKLPQVDAHALEVLVDRAVGEGDSDEQYLTMVHQAIVGATGTDGLLALYSAVLLDRLSVAAGSMKGDSGLHSVAEDLLSYYTYLLSCQVNAMTLVVEGKTYQGVDPALIESEWRTYHQNIGVQLDLLFVSLGQVLLAWITTSGYEFYPGPTFSDEQTNLCFGSGIAQKGGAKDWAAWYEASYEAAVKAPEQVFWTVAERLALGALPPTTPSKYRVVIHVIAYSSISKDAMSKIVKELRLSNCATSPEVYQDTSSPWRPDLALGFVRLVFDVDKPGSYKMEDLNETFPVMHGYLGHDYRLQSSADLSLTCSVDDKSPLGIIRFVPYCSAE